MADTKAMAEVKALENFYAVLQTEPSRAFYGYKHVLKANEGQAIDTLLVSDNLFRYVKEPFVHNDYESLHFPTIMSQVSKRGGT